MGEPADSVYEASLVQIRSWRDALAEGLLAFICMALWLPSKDPKFTVVVRRRDQTDDGVGVRDARRRREAEAQLLEIRILLRASSAEEVRAALPLEA
ncbi:hypothetical protein ACFQ0K_16630 [Nocardioides caeni]|uniref:Uncharacterized protein n=1 Tax=Nocardioides caeni TaxID=574700 RepID=A0A4V4HKX1_9ACTN|nr:hypothetical protein [Nocardioides caeni]THV16056.1 hypothetical protein E9934_06895 [Nocardioides caeni]